MTENQPREIPDDTRRMVAIDVLGEVLSGESPEALLAYHLARDRGAPYAKAVDEYRVVLSNVDARAMIWMVGFMVMFATVFCIGYLVGSHT